MFGKLKVKSTLFVFLVLAIAVSIPASADTPKNYNAYGQGQVITNFANIHSVFRPNIIYDTITQGQTKWSSKTVSSYITVLNVDLNWGNPSNSLQLTIYGADGSTYGQYYDNADGNIDGRINLGISYPGGVPQGTWYYKVYGYSVSGTQSYSI